MASKLLAVVLAAAVLTVGGYTYWEFADGGCCKAKAPAEATATTPCDSATPPCCQEPSRTSCIALAPGEGCCEDLPSTVGSSEVLTIMPHEVK
jgi:hypothetical protein